MTEKMELPDHVRRHLESRNVDVKSLDPEVHNALAALSQQEVGVLASVKGKLDAAGAPDDVAAGIV